jgi:hypothetical protein
MTSAHAPRLVTEFERYFKTNSTAPKGTYKSFVIKGESNPAQVAKLLELLDKNGIRYGKGTAKTGLKGYEYQSGKVSVPFSTSDKDIVISAYQPKSVLTQVLFEPNPALHDSITYDITSWAMPYAYGLKAFALDPTRSKRRLRKSNSNPLSTRSYSSSLLGSLARYPRCSIPCSTTQQENSRTLRRIPLLGGG